MAAAFKVRHSRPTGLSDPFRDFTNAELRRLLAKPGHRMQWNDYRQLLGPFLPAGTYDESVYFLPRAFDFIIAHDDDALDLVTSLVWFVSEYAEQLKQDGYLDAACDRLRDCFRHWTNRFAVVHYDRDGCKAKGWPRVYFDYVQNTETVCRGTCDLVEFKRHQGIAVEFAESLAHHGGDDVKAAWFLEYARSQTDIHHPPALPVIRQLLADRSLLEGAAEVVRAKRAAGESSPTYWSDTFRILGL